MLTVVLLTFFLLAAFLIAPLIMWRSNLRNPLLRTWLLLVLINYRDHNAFIHWGRHSVEIDFLSKIQT